MTLVALAFVLQTLVNSIECANLLYAKLAQVWKIFGLNVKTCSIFSNKKLALDITNGGLNR
jgi:hypothetical protein